MGFFDRPAGDVGLALALAQLVQLVENTASQNAIDTAVQALGNGMPLSVLNRDSTAYPNLYFASVGNYSLLLLGCVKSAGMGVQLMAGYSPLSNLPPRAIQNAWGSAAVGFIQTYLRDNVRLFPPNWILAGHSGGGLVCQCYAYMLSTAPNPTSAHVFTFGSPRAGGRTFANAGQGVATSTVRYMGDTDPVPLIPPSLSDALGWAALLGPADLTFFSEWVHTDGGRMIDSQGKLSDNVLPVNAALTPVASLGNFLYSADTVAGNAHTIQEYIDRLTLAQPSPQQPNDMGPKLAPMENRVRPPRRQVNVAQAQAQAAIFQEGRDQNVAPVIIPAASEFQAVRQGRIWAIQFQGQFIAYAPSKKRARHLARAGNDFIRSLQHQGIVDSIAMTQQFASYITQASDPAGGFQPVMNTVFPS
jgi:pimeloyl-ACP methyl ester carboxylesterase